MYIYICVCVYLCGCQVSMIEAAIAACVCVSHLYIGRRWSQTYTHISQTYTRNSHMNTCTHTHNCQGMSPHQAAEEGKTQIVRALLVYGGVDVDVRNEVCVCAYTCCIVVVYARVLSRCRFFFMRATLRRFCPNEEDTYTHTHRHHDTNKLLLTNLVCQYYVSMHMHVVCLL